MQCPNCSQEIKKTNEELVIHNRRVFTSYILPSGIPDWFEQPCPGSGTSGVHAEETLIYNGRKMN